MTSLRARSGLLRRWLPVAALGVTLCSSSAIAGFAVQGGKLVEGSGVPFVMRGVNHGHTWYKGRTNQAITDIAATGANTIRVVLAAGAQWARDDGASVASIIEAAKAKKMIVVLEVHDSTGFGDNAAAANPSVAVDYFLSPDIKAAIQGQEDYVIVNFANEFVGNGAIQSQWVSISQTAISRLRAGGLRHTLMIDAPNWGQDWSGTMQANAASVFNSDVQRNTVFSVHMYDSYTTAASVQNYLQGFQAKGLPLVVGEFSADVKGTAVAIDAILATSQQLGMGYLGWSWSGNSADIASMDIAVNWNSATLSSFGNRLINGANGIRQTAKPATIFSGLVTPPVAADLGVAVGKPVVASSVEGLGFEADKAFDGNANTRWASTLSAATATLTVDLGAQYAISGLKLNWEAAYASGYNIQVSSDNVNFSAPIYTKAGGTGGIEAITATGQGRYVRINMTAKGTTWGYSLWDVAVFGSALTSVPASVAASSAVASSTPTAQTPPGTGVNLALGKVMTASTVDAVGREANKANDGSATTRWSSSYADANWISVDLGANYLLSSVRLRWEAAYARAYQIQTSLDGANWTTIYSTAAGAGGTETFAVNGMGRYVRMNGLTRATPWGYSLWEFEVFGGAFATSSAAPVSSAAVASSTPAPSSRPLSSTPVVLSSLSRSSAPAVLPGLTCVVRKTSDWGTGYSADVVLTNTSATALNGWRVNLSLPANTTLASSWNATLTGTNPIVAANASFNGTIASGGSTSFGIQANYTGTYAAPLCSSGTVTTPPPSSAIVVTSSRAPLSSSAAVSSVPPTGSQTFAGVSTHFNSLGFPFGGCGVPEANLESKNYVALNVYHAPGNYTTFWSRPLVGADTAFMGAWENGKNCGRWVRVTIQEACNGLNDGAPNQPFCRGGTGWFVDGNVGATLDMLVTDSCGDNNAWCRDSRYHLDLSTFSLGQFTINGAPADLASNNFVNFNNRKISWNYIEAPGYTGDIKIHFMQNAQQLWPAIMINNLRNGIHGVEQLVNGVWKSVPMNSDMGQSYILDASVTTYQIRVLDANDQYVNAGRVYNFNFPAACGTKCSLPVTPVNYTIQ